MRHEVGQTGFDLRQWICDLRRADTLASRTQNREQSSFVDVDHNEVAGVSPDVCLLIYTRLICSADLLVDHILLSDRGHVRTVFRVLEKVLAGLHSGHELCGE
jgi:hypothetical protein